MKIFLSISCAATNGMRIDSYRTMTEMFNESETITKSHTITVLVAMAGLPIMTGVSEKLNTIIVRSAEIIFCYKS